MGFLLGAYGKLMAGKRVRQLQARMISVQSQLRRATRDIENMERQINAQQRQMTNTIRTMGSMQMFGLQSYNQTELANLQASIFDKHGLTGIKFDDMTDEQKKSYSNAISEYQMNASLVNNQMSSMQQMMQTTMMQQQQQVENYVEMMKEMQLEPLKDLEEDLQMEKESLESQIQLAQQDYEACKEIEKSGSKSLAPQYTGQG